MVNHLTTKTTTSFKTSLAANATYTLVKPDLTSYLSIIEPVSSARVQCPVPVQCQYVE